MNKKASLKKFVEKYAAYDKPVSTDSPFWGKGLMSGPEQGSFDFLEKIRKRDGYVGMGGQMKKASLKP